MTSFMVDPARLREAAERLGRAAGAARAVVDHPGVVRGWAQDGGCEQLRDAAARFARRWEHGLRLLADDLGRTRDVLTLVADTYASADDGVAGSFGPAGAPAGAAR